MPSIGDLANDVAAALYEARIPVAIGSIVAAVLLFIVARRLGWFAAARRHPGRTSALVAAALAVAVPLGWYLGSPIFIRTSLAEPAPIAAEGAPVAPQASPTPTATRSSQAASASPTPQRSVVVATGSFSGSDEFHFGRGTASIIEVQPGRYHLRLEDFSVRNGPDLYVYLSPDPNGYASDALELGRLKATDGNFGYDLPAGVDPGRFSSAVIWCKQFSHLFATAPLQGA
jgi:electron transfer DM13